MLRRIQWRLLLLLLVVGLLLTVLLVAGRATTVEQPPVHEDSGEDTHDLDIAAEQAAELEQTPTPESGDWSIPLKERSSAEALQRWLADGDWTERYEAALLLGVLGREAEVAVGSLAHALEDGSGSVRIEAARAHWRVTGSPALAVRTLADCLRHGDGITQVDAALTLGVMGRHAVEAVPVLVAVVLGRSGPGAGTLDNYDPIGVYSCPAEEYVFISPEAAAARALGKIGVHSDEVADALQRIAESGDVRATAWATEALARLRSP